MAILPAVQTKQTVSCKLEAWREFFCSHVYADRTGSASRQCFISVVYCHNLQNIVTPLGLFLFVRWFSFAIEFKQTLKKTNKSSKECDDDESSSDNSFDEEEISTVKKLKTDYCNSGTSERILGRGTRFGKPAMRKAMRGLGGVTPQLQGGPGALPQENC